ncbi:MAG: HutD family protein [Rhizobiales bacterium]|nr:HutD family protein [Hyphomicrobiales bacterium]
MHVIRSRDYRRMPWKNGGGETTEIIVQPTGASLDDFDWRVSMARVGSSGPFSAFPSVDRTLCILSGRGIDLTIAGRGAVRLDRDAAPLSFPGDVPAGADLVDGPVEDLNAMTRRGRFRHVLTRVALDRPTQLPRAGEVMLVLFRGAGAALGAAAAAGAEEIMVEDGDTVVLDVEADVALEIRPNTALDLYVIAITRG